MDERERPEAGDEWIAKAMLLGATFRMDLSLRGALWAVKVPGGHEYFGVTQARACRRLVRSIVGDVQ